MVGDHAVLEKNVFDAAANMDGVTGSMKSVKAEM